MQLELVRLAQEIDWPVLEERFGEVYSDGPGNKGRAFKGFAYLPEDDLLGLVGRHPTQKNPVRS